MRVRMDVCGRRVVLSLAAAEQIMEIAFSEGEVCEEKWNSSKDGKPAYYTTHVYDIDPSKFQYNAELITEAQYQMYRLAGKPE